MFRPHFLDSNHDAPARWVLAVGLRRGPHDALGSGSTVHIPTAWRPPGLWCGRRNSGLPLSVLSSETPKVSAGLANALRG